MALSDIEVRDLEEQHTAVIRRQLPLAEASRIPELIGQTYEAVQATGVEPAGMPFVRRLSMATAPLNLEIGWPLAAPFTGNGDAEVITSTLPAGPTAVASYFGPYEGIASAYEAIQTWCAEQHHPIAGAPWESYFTSPNEEPDPEKWRTDIHFPVSA